MSAAMTSSPVSFDSSLDQRVARRLGELHELIESCGRSLADVRIVAVTKGFDDHVVAAALRCGLDHLAENYLDELTRKQVRTDATVTWHFLGALQSRKIVAIAQHADVIASLSRRREIEILAQQSRRPAVYIQIDYTGAAGRSGVAPDQLDELVGAARDAGLDLRGLMTVAPIDPELARGAFNSLARAADRFQLKERSMGMSDDLVAALLAGSSEIRVGRALFGDRFAALDAGGIT
jgi:uncharacterized pyridoxal phosphate-containing UPF0001 family protein